MDELLDDFLAETNENLDTLTNDLVAWEKQPADRSLLDGIFRFFHTIKGSAGFLDFERLGRLSHAAETALSRARDGGMVPDAWFVSSIFAAIDEIRGILGALADNRVEPDGSDSELIDRLEDAANGIRPEKTLTESASMQDDASASEPLKGAVSKLHHASTVRVPVDLLDRLMNLASELVLARNALLRSARNGEEMPINLIEHVSTCVTDLQDGINRTRMQPIEALWTPFPRLVRDLARELSKDLELALEGGDTEIDRQLLEAMRDPIGHMVRNACDHGIETPEARRQAGKKPVGTIRLVARQSGGYIYIELSDDGRGIDPDRLRARAVSMGLMDEAAAAELSDGAAQALIFEPGLSTASTVTAISGRGVGMDVVRNNLERIGGTVEVRSRVGHGTQFIIRIPMTLTIVPALIVGIADQSYAIGQSSIREIVRLKDGHVLTAVGGRPMMELREALIPVIDMAALFGNVQPVEAERWGVIVEIGGIGRVALLVDAVNDQEEIVIKPVSPLIGANAIYSGATILGSGEAALVLDLAGIAAMTSISAGAVADEVKTGQTAAVDTDASWLLFEAGSTSLKAIPLGLVARIESLDRTAVSYAGGRWLLCYDGQLLPLNSLGADPAQAEAGELVLVLDDGYRRVATPVSRVADIVNHAMEIEQPAIVPGISGLTMVDGRSVEIVDICWLMGHSGAPAHRLCGSILIIGNRHFASGLLKPLLEGAGHVTTIVADETEAAGLFERGMTFDLILAEGDVATPQGTSATLLRVDAGNQGKSDGRIDPYDRDNLLNAVNGSLRRIMGAAA